MLSPTLSLLSHCDIPHISTLQDFSAPLSWLREKKVQFCLRLKKDELVEVEQGIWYELDELGLKARNFFVPLWYKSDKNSQSFGL
jgi:hypothetical protein